MQFNHYLAEYKEACKVIPKNNRNYELAQLIAKIIIYYGYELHYLGMVIDSSKKKNNNVRKNFLNRKLNWLHAILEEYTELVDGYPDNICLVFKKFNIPKEIQVKIEQEYLTMLEEIAERKKEERKTRADIINSYKQGR